MKHPVWQTLCTRNTSAFPQAKPPNTPFLSLCSKPWHNLLSSLRKEESKQRRNELKSASYFIPAKVGNAETNRSSDLFFYKTTPARTLSCDLIFFKSAPFSHERGHAKIKNQSFIHCAIFPVPQNEPSRAYPDCNAIGYEACAIRL